MVWDAIIELCDKICDQHISDDDNSYRREEFDRRIPGINFYPGGAYHATDIESNTFLHIQEFQTICTGQKQPQYSSWVKLEL